SVPPYEQVMGPDDLLMKPAQRRSAITRDEAARIAAEHLGRVPDLVAAKVGKVVAWAEIDGRRPCLLNAPPGIEDSWVAYLEFPGEDLIIRSSRVIIVSRESGAVVFSGDANDEGLEERGRDQRGWATG